MEPIEVKSVTFYQTVRLNGKEEKTVSKDVASMFRNVEIVFKDDKIFIRDRDWVKHFKDTVSIIGLHNVRHFSVSKEVFMDCEYKDVFKAIKKKAPGKIKVQDPAPIPVASDPHPLKPATKIATPVDGPGFDVMSDDEKSILLKMELKRFRIDFDKRWGPKKLLEQFNSERAKM